MKHFDQGIQAYDFYPACLDKKNHIILLLTIALLNLPSAFIFLCPWMKSQSFIILKK